MGKSSFLQEFKAFAMKGNVVDMAVGVIIGYRGELSYCAKHGGR